MKYKYRSDCKNREENNPYAPFVDYYEYRNYIVIQAVDINNMVAGMSPPVIAEIWLHDANFRRIFKRMTYMSRYIHFEESLQSLIPWCFVNIKEYCKRFDGIQQENLLKMLR
jgi:hypothetical protein|nr:hypothetical protein [Bacteroides intestinalis]